VGAWRYAADPTTQVLCVGFAVDVEPTRIWIPGQPIPLEFAQAASDPSWHVVAHNDLFERAIEERILAPQVNWPLVPIERHICTMGLALANALPGALEKAAAALQLPYQKDAAGKRLMLQLSRPRRARKGEDPNVLHWIDDPDLLERLYRYCEKDVEAERALFHHLPPLSPEEQQLWILDAQINRRGFAVDVELAQGACEIVRAEQEALNLEISVLTDGKVTSVNQVARIQELLRERGHQLTTLSKRSVSAVLAHDPPEETRRLLELRRAGALASVRKLESLLASVDSDSRLRGTLKYHGSSTGRWSGTLYQPQNLKKPQSKDLDAAVDAVLARDRNSIRQLGDPLSIIADLSRSMICAAPGHMLVGGDLSAVESRILSWLAGETWKIENYRAFDRTGDPKLEPYCVTASRMLGRSVTPDDEPGRQIGKTADLALGFGGGLRAWRRFNPDDPRSDDEITRNVADWRAAHPAIVRFWRTLENTIRRSIRTGQRVSLGNLAAEYTGGNLYLVLPSGRRLVYPEAHLGLGQFKGTTQVYFKDNARGGWDEIRGWYGTWAENVVQAVARDLLASAIARAEAAGLAVVLHVHDELVTEIPEEHVDTEQFLKLMTTPPAWAAGLPIAAKVRAGKRYAKTESKTTAAQPAERVTAIQPEKPAAIDAGVATPIPGTKLLNGTSVPFDFTAEPIVLERAQKPVPVPLADIIGGPLADGKLCCPFHDDSTPSLHIYADHYHCFACGAHGDVFDWLREIEGLDYEAALELLTNWQGPVSKPQNRSSDARTLASALRLWELAQPIAGTPAIRYLADVRGIDVDALPTNIETVLRWHPRCPFGPGVTQPSLIALYRDVESDAPAGIHRIAVTPEALAGGKVERRTLGRWPTPRAIKLWPVTAQLFLGEGIETVLAAATRMQYRDAPMQPAWAAGASGNLAKFPVLLGLERLILLVDYDPAGEASIETCRVRWREAGRDVRRLRPQLPGSDFNDLVLAKLRAVS
jgi:DNA polymerase